MVDKTNNETGTNDAASDSMKNPVKKRPRIFGARKKRVEEPTASAPEATGADSTPADSVPADPSPAVQAPAEPARAG